MPGDGAAGAGDGVVRDSRFKTLHNDPRFMNFPAATNKTKIDGRFAKMFSDPNFGTGARGNRDKRGRRTDKAKRKSAADDLKQYYDLEEDEGVAMRGESIVSDGTANDTLIFELLEEADQVVEAAKQPQSEQRTRYKPKKRLELFLHVPGKKGHQIPQEPPRRYCSYSRAPPVRHCV